MAVVSSNCFGLKLLSSGLTKYEMKQLIRIKILHSVIFENVPQLFFQALYASQGQVSDWNTVLLASTASLLSVIASCLAYFIDHRDDADDMEVAQYYLAMERKPVAATTPNQQSFGTPSGPSALEPQRTIPQGDRDKIEQFKGHRQSLSQKLSEMWDAPEKSIEIGATTMTETGSITHIVHLMKRADIDDIALDLCGDRDDNRVNPMFIVKQFYAMESKRVGVNRIFREHFDLDHQFKVELRSQSQKRRRTMEMASKHSVFSTGSSSMTTARKSTSYRGSTILSKGDRMQFALKEFFENGGGGTDVIRMVEMMQSDGVALPDIIEEGAPGVGNGGTANLYHGAMERNDTSMVDDVEIVMANTKDDESYTL